MPNYVTHYTTPSGVSLFNFCKVHCLQKTAFAPLSALPLVCSYNLVCFSVFATAANHICICDFFLIGA